MLFTWQFTMNDACSIEATLNGSPQFMTFLSSRGHFVSQLAIETSISIMIIA